MHFDRRSFSRNLIAAAGIALIGISAQAQPRLSADEGGLHSGKFFTSTNSAGANELLVYGNDPAGTLVLLARYQTLGLGLGSGLGSQGAVTLSGDGRWLFVVNAGSNSVSTFAVRAGALILTSVQDSAGLRPISISEHDGLVYVLDADGAGNVAGFRNQQGTLVPVTGSVQPLSAAGGTGPAQVAIGIEGDVLVVTEKNTNRLTSYALGTDGGAGAPIVTPSSGTTPFGLVFDRHNHLLVSEAFAGAANASALSTYRFDASAPATPVSVSPSVATTQTSACWAAVTPSGRFAYTANAASGTVSSFATTRSGAATLLNGVAANPGADSGPVDMAIAAHGRTLAVLAGRVSTVFSYAVATDGSLSPAASVAGLPAGAAGLAAN